MGKLGHGRGSARGDVASRERVASGREPEGSETLPAHEDSTPREDVGLSERERQLEAQLEEAYAEVLRLRQERFEVVYTATWLIVRPLLRMEEALAGLARRLLGRDGAPRD